MKTNKIRKCRIRKISFKSIDFRIQNFLSILALSRGLGFIYYTNFSELN